VFKGETLRSMLLNAYGWWKVSQITYIAAIVAFAVIGKASDGIVVLATAPLLRWQDAFAATPERS